MATWKELSQDNLEAAQALLREKYWRSSVSRSYYAACCAVSEKLADNGVQFARGWNNPAHDQLLFLVRNGLTLTPGARRQTAAALRRLRLALASVHEARLILQIMEA